MKVSDYIIKKCLENDIDTAFVVTGGAAMHLNESIGKSKLKVSVYGRNLLDEVARNHSSFVKNEVPLPGKNLGIKFNFTF